jgi:hypothetical protein
VILTILYTLLYFLQLFWFYKILGSLTRNLGKKKGGADAGVKKKEGPKNE